MASAATADAPREPAAPSRENEALKAGAATAALRKTMVERQLRPFDVTDAPLLSRFLALPREAFLPAALAPLAYSDLALSAKGASETRWIAPPLVLARLLQAGEIRPEHKVLDVAGGAGYAAALVSGLAARVVALESDAELAAQARAHLANVGAANVTVLTGPLAEGAPGAGPFDVILIHGAVDCGLERLFAQLTPNGRLLAYKRPDPGSGVKAVRFERSQGKNAGERALFDAAAAPLAAFAEAPTFRF